MRPRSRNVPGLAEALHGLVSSLGGDISPRNVMRVAEALWLTGNPDRAIELLEPLTNKDSSAISPRVLLGWCYEDSGRAEEAEETLRIVRELDPANPYGQPASPPAPAPAPTPTPEEPEVARVEDDFELELIGPAAPEPGPPAPPEIGEAPPPPEDSERGTEPPSRPERSPTEDSEREAEPEDALTEEELLAIPPGPLYSETLAKMFEKQGFGAKAREIYEDLIRRHPERVDLREKIESLEREGEAAP